MEQSSVFARINISKEKLNQFLKEKPAVPNFEDGWLDWWDNAEMYDDNTLTQKDVFNYDEKTNEKVVNFWMKKSRTIPFFDYDEKNGIWHFGMLLFSENYNEIIPMLAFLRSIESFREKNDADFIIVYDYFWSDGETYDVMAFLKFQNSKSKFVSDFNNESLTYANNYLDRKYAEIEKRKPFWKNWF